MTDLICSIRSDTAFVGPFPCTGRNEGMPMMLIIVERSCLQDTKTTRAMIKSRSAIQGRATFEEKFEEKMLCPWQKAVEFQRFSVTAYVSRYPVIESVAVSCEVPATSISLSYKLDFRSSLSPQSLVWSHYTKAPPPSPNRLTSYIAPITC